ncbi:MAG: hypothetical protein R3301_10890 [Saprospiraceae bacterium]|nr:hypothetical protein [Saprospiraceae bacterium]
MSGLVDIPLNRAACLLATALLTCCSVSAVAQIKAPGHDRDLETIKTMRANAVLDRDSVTLVDTIVLFDPDTYVQTTRIIKSTMSIRDYCTELLGYDSPDELLKGEVITITNPQTYQPMKIKWNPARSKIDTIPQRQP